VLAVIAAKLSASVPSKSNSAAVIGIRCSNGFGVSGVVLS
jgi:hypothetical protein